MKSLIDAFTTLTSKGFHTDTFGFTMHRNGEGMNIEVTMQESGMYLYAYRNGQELDRLFIKKDNLGDGDSAGHIVDMFIRQVQGEEIDKAKRGPADGMWLPGF